MPYLMGGTVCEPNDQTTYCEFSRNFHMLTMVLMIIFGIDLVLGGNLLNWFKGRLLKNLKK